MSRGASTDVSNRIEMRYRPVLQFDLARMFEPGAFREVASDTVREYMKVSTTI
jgi:hypothetical protein